MPKTATNRLRRDSAIRVLADELQAAVGRRQGGLTEAMSRRDAAPDDRDVSVHFLRAVQTEDTIYENAVYEALDRYRRAMCVEEREPPQPGGV
jgi:hypothetical protein